MKRILGFLAIPLFLIIIFLLQFLPATASKTFPVMGTEVTITITDRNPSQHIGAAYSRLKEIESKMNRFDPYSEISRINREGFGAKVAVSQDTFDCISLAENISKITDGAFDITLTGNYKSLLLDKKYLTVGFKKPGITINLDGIAKGYGIESARRLLFKRGVKNAMIDARSSIAVIGGPWKIGLSDPRNNGEIIKIITLGSYEAVSTSGIEQQGLHIVNPKTGKPANGCVSVTLIGHDAGYLDGLSTGLFVLGPMNGKKLARRLGQKAIIITKDQIITL